MQTKTNENKKSSQTRKKNNHNNNNNNNNKDVDENDSGSSYDFMFKDNNSDSSYNDSDDGLVVIADDERSQQRQSRNSKSRLSVPNGLSNINIAAELAASDSDQTPEKNDHSKANNHDNNSTNNNNNNHNDINHNKRRNRHRNEKKIASPANADDYPLALPAIPQASSVNHIVDASKTPSDISNKHEKKKSMTQLHLEDLELDRKFNQESKSKRKSSHQSQAQSLSSQPLTPLAMMTQIANMPDIGDISIGESNFTHNNGYSNNHKETSLTSKTATSDYKLQQMIVDGTNEMMLMSTSVSVPSPPSLKNNAAHTHFQISAEYEADDYDNNNENELADMNNDDSAGIKPNSRRITPKAIGSEEYIDIFNEEQRQQQEQQQKEKKKEKRFNFDVAPNDNNNKILQIKSRESVNTANNNITDVNYANNHALAHGINRADSDYKPLINKNIDEILIETQLYQQQQQRTSHKYVDSVDSIEHAQKMGRLSHMGKEDSVRAPPGSTPVMISPQLDVDLNHLNYAFDQFSNHFSHKTPIIMSDDEDDDDDYNNEADIKFHKIQETLLIIKKDGEQFINEICDKLANDDEFYINEFTEIQREEYDTMKQFLNKMRNKDLNHATNIDIKCVILLFNELLINDSFSIIPLYRVNAISYLYKCIAKYQSLKLLDDEVSVNTVNLEKLDSKIKDNNFDFHSHLKKPTDELQVLDNVHFDDYDEYPSDEVDKMTPSTNANTNTNNNDNNNNYNHHNIMEQIDDEKIRELFTSENVYCPRNRNEYNMIKQVLCPNTKLFQFEDNNLMNKYSFMESIGIIKPNVVRDCGDQIRATLIGNGFIISQIKAIKYTALQFETILNSMDSNNYYQTKNVRNEAIRYLSSGTIIIMIIKKPIGIDNDCLNEKDCFHKLSELIGFIDPEIDRQNDENTQSIRGCFGEDLIHNAIDVTMTQNDYKSLYKLFS